MGTFHRTRTLVALGLVGLVAAVTPPASADPIAGGTASSFALTATINGTDLIPPTPTAKATAPPFADDQDATAIPIDAAPLAVNGTLVARAAVHTASDIPSSLEQSTQPVAGPYNAAAVGQIEDLLVLIDEGIPGGQLINADVLRGEAVAVCSGGTVKYSAESEVVNLKISDQDPLSGPLNDLVDEIAAGINGSPLAELVTIEPNVVTVTPTGASVDALVITLLSGAGQPEPPVQIRIGHAEVTGVGCAPAAGGDDKPQCSDTQDNDGDGKIDATDPGCHDDGNAGNPDSYNPNDDDETDTAVLGESLAKTTVPAAADPLPATGASVATGLAAALGLGSLALLAVRRRLA